MHGPILPASGRAGRNFPLFLTDRVRFSAGLRFLFSWGMKSIRLYSAPLRRGGCKNMAPQSTTALLTPDTTMQIGREFAANTPGAVADHSSGPASPTKEDPPLRAVHTSNFPALLRQLGA